MTPFLILLFAGGCGEERPYTTVEVSGRVTLDGEPLAGAHLTFQPNTKVSRGPGSFGLTDEEGRYRLETTAGDTGAVVGRHRVSITAKDGPPLPRRYNHDSELSVDIVAKGPQTADFPLVGDVE